VDLADKAELAAALRRLKRVFGTEPLPSLEKEYLSGRLSDPGLYEKLGHGGLDGRPLWAYFLMAEGFLRQPDVNQYYDIFRAARAIPLLRALDIAVELLPGVDICNQLQRAVSGTCQRI